MNKTMKWILVLLVIAALDAVAFLAWADGPESMEAMQRAMTPGGPHRDLADQAGSWSYVVTIFEEGSEAMQLEGVSKKTMILGGRYLKEELRGEFMGMPFEGFGLSGYDNVTGEFRSVWLDNASTAIHYYTGHEKRDGSQEFQSTMHDPATSTAIHTRSVARTIDYDNHTFESYLKLPDGTEQLHMRVEYTRAE